MNQEQANQVKNLYIALSALLNTLLPNSLEKYQAIARLAESSYWAERCIKLGSVSSNGSNDEN